VSQPTFPTGRSTATPPSVDEIIAAIAALQHGLITFLQLLAAGLTDSAITKRVARGVLHRIHRGVYAVGVAALSPEARWHAATLAAGEGSALGLLSAATLREISRFRSPLVAVLSPRRRRLDGVQVHRYRSLDPRDVTTHKGIPVTTVHRTQVDLTDVLTPHQLTNVIYQAAYKGLYVESATRDSMARANGRHNLHKLDKAIALYNSGSAGTRSAPEDAFLRLDFPEPMVNTGFEGFEVDFRWPDLKLAVEIDGAHHGRPPDRAADARQDQALQAAGYETLRFTDDDVYQRPQQILWALNAYR
jgi:predicted transcriptional regulator of viral defense system